MDVDGALMELDVSNLDFSEVLSPISPQEDISFNEKHNLLASYYQVPN